MGERSILEVFWRFFALGWISFGGPAAHLGYFREAFVERRSWISEEAYARLIALSQFLPGPGSSQVGFALGCHRAGLLGGLAAFLGFTLPSFLIMVGLSILSRATDFGGSIESLVAGLKLLAVVVVAHAVFGMYGKFCRTKLGVVLAALTAAAVLALPGLMIQLLVLLASAACGALVGREAISGSEKAPSTQPSEEEASGRIRLLPLTAFGLLLLALPFAANHAIWAKLFADFYLAGSLVFGGGHVVLPLLESTVGDAMSRDRFLFGYAAAQAIPGPMFAVCSFFGSELRPSSPWLGAGVATIAVFLPGFLLVRALSASWHRLAEGPRVAAAVAGINAAVVGLLLAALYQPVFRSAVGGPEAMALVLLGFLGLRTFKPPMWIMVLCFAALGLGFGDHLAAV